MAFEGRAIPIVLLSGMATDERLFAPQLAAFPNLRVQPWIDPLPKESLPDYAKRLALVANPGRPCIVGGASFGGAVALEMAQHLPALACILIGSVRSPSSLPCKWRLSRPFARLGPGALRAFASLAARFGRPFVSSGAVLRLERLSRPEAAFVRWAMCAIVGWRPSAAIETMRVFHIHGANDPVLPASLGKPDVVVPGGVHALPLFSAAAVNEFIAQTMKAVQMEKR